ncbi:uncharacterized protein MYCGRDRAFT_109300 [Zymoseptoria tritici IPO323]|uniref:RNA polymerase II subunit B1 CTD phosphatase RPAP2 homolog n=1 Tax=Zymoseptoria tritici (strain CBS 115943 / IPO323) TaxID=336722 RepID=F9X8N6_ZYMTI|nr:uncharacterized protein MYCGRDRAFT_109300 [Zymoseptoria tritici IPO323]EGP88209.1 hypothetical protein MYCGRDRAFT_109300 [Zymoseptoria tritici IPO323]
MASTTPLKSILRPQPPRKKKVPEVTEEQKAQIEKDKRNLDLALKHAHRIQYQKDVEATILNSTIALLDFPSSSTFTAREALAFTTLVKNFQPSDYDSLIEERRIDSKCGYVLCPQAPRAITLGASAAWKLKKGAGDWCSDHCAKKALYVRTQLSEVPAWERVPQQVPDIQLHADDAPPEDDPLVRRAKRAERVNEWRTKVADDEELAAERGEKTASFRPNQVMSEAVVEKKVTGRAKAPEMEGDLFAMPGGLIEGYAPRKVVAKSRIGGKAQADEYEDDEEEEDYEEELDDYDE